jgi:hypothetical protein
MRNRAIRATDFNAESSRSHTILKLFITVEEVDDDGNGFLTFDEFEILMEKMELGVSKQELLVYLQLMYNKARQGAKPSPTPTAPTPITSAFDTQIATTEFVKRAITGNEISSGQITGVVPVANGGTGESTYVN